MSTIPSYPKDFLWGIAMASYQVEGHLNEPGEPKNNWFPWEQKHRIEGCGQACDFWNLYREDIERASTLGINSVRLSIEWARLQPREGKALDPAALERYVDMLGELHCKGLKAVLTLQHFTHPLWLGLDPWLTDRGARAFEAFVEALIPALNRRLQEKYSAPPVPFYVTVNEPNILGAANYILGVFPHGVSKGRRRCYHSFMAGILKGHLLAYRKIHSIYEKEGWKRPLVTWNNWGCGLYAMDKIFVDMLGMREVTASVLKEELLPFHSQWQRDMKALFSEGGLPAWRFRMERFLDQWLAFRFQWKAYQDLLNLKGSEPVIDGLSIDYYDPFLSRYLLRSPHLLRLNPWEWDTAPELFSGFIKAYLSGHPKKSIYILENGIAYRQGPLQKAFRKDGKTRGEELKKHIHQVDSLMGQSIPLKGYFYWSLTDNYEWGSFKPRFGIFGMDYQSQRRSLTDAAGERVDLLYRQIIEDRAFS